MLVFTCRGILSNENETRKPKQNTDSAYDSAAFDLEKTFRLLHFEHKEVLRTSIILGLRHYREKGHVLFFFCDSNFIKVMTLSFQLSAFLQAVSILRIQS